MTTDQVTKKPRYPRPRRRYIVLERMKTAGERVSHKEGGYLQG